jgi:hypothetical protein
VDGSEIHVVSLESMTVDLMGVVFWVVMEKMARVTLE